MHGHVHQLVLVAYTIHIDQTLCIYASPHTCSRTSHFRRYSKTRYKKLVTHVESHASAVSLLESGEQRYSKATNNSPAALPWSSRCRRWPRSGTSPSAPSVRTSASSWLSWQHSRSPSVSGTHPDMNPRYFITGAALHKGTIPSLISLMVSVYGR